MSYLFQSNLLPIEWTQVVAKHSNFTDKERDSFEEEFGNSYESAISREILPIRDKMGMTVKGVCTPNSNYYVYLRDFCEWGKLAINSGIPTDEYELAHHLKIHEMGESGSYVIEQVTFPPSSKTNFLRNIGKNAPHLLLSGELDKHALPLTPCLVISSSKKLVTANPLYRQEELATPKQLINAFGSRTGMNESWFKRLSDSPGLISARKQIGRGGSRSSFIEPLFCPYEVMLWLFTCRKKNSNKLSENIGWKVLKRSFRPVYDKYESFSPMEDDPG